MKNLSVKLREEDHERLAVHAAAVGETPSAYARRLLVGAMQNELVPAASVAQPDAVPALGSTEDLRKAVWALIVALSHTLDEEKAAEFVADYFDGAASVGYRPRAEGKP